MRKGSRIYLPAILAILICSTQASALTSLTFRDVDKQIGSTSWTQVLEDTSFSTPLTGTHTLTITSAILKLAFEFKPEKIEGTKKRYGDTFTLWLGDVNAGTYQYTSRSNKARNAVWTVSLTDPAILKDLSDKNVDVRLVSSLGTITDVKRSVLRGNATIAPEPISMALVGAGLLGLPFARRFRKLLS